MSTGVVKVSASRSRLISGKMKCLMIQNLLKYTIKTIPQMLTKLTHPKLVPINGRKVPIEKIVGLVNMKKNWVKNTENWKQTVNYLPSPT